jgi:hypothetical protein
MKPSQEQALREAAAAIDFLAPTFSFRALRTVANEMAELVEANAESSYGFLLRGAIQEFSNDAYQDHPVIYPGLVTPVDSAKLSELYGGLYRSNLPSETDAGEEFQESNFKGFEREIRNKKFGRIEKFERELFDDDQTGQVRRRAGEMGEGYRTFEEIYILNRLFGLATTSEGVNVPASTYGSGTVFSTAIGNRPTTFTLLSQTELELAHVALRGLTDPTGRKFVVIPRVLITSHVDELEAARILGSPLMSNTADAVGLRVNPLQGKYTPYSSPFLPSRAWAVGDPKKGFVLQRRSPIEVTQENPGSGDSFKKEVYAFRIRSRWEADWVEPRFLYLGNDGTVTS